ncbi:MAG: hypothetical protein AAGA54_12320 [Myxococcota bacterium]
MTSLNLTLGIDIGRVIISAGETAGDTSFLSGSDDDAMQTPPMRDGFAVIGRLVEATGGRVWLVSKAGPRIARRSERWLAHHRFYARTGVTEGNLRFCRERREKAAICSGLRIDAFIDDRPDVLQPMLGIVEHRLLFGPQRRGRGNRTGLTPVADWSRVAGYFGV